MTENASDIYSQVTQRIIMDLEKGVRPWQQPWTYPKSQGDISIPLRHNGTPYQGINVLMLWTDAIAKGFSSPVWLTYKQAQFQGAQVRRAERGTPVLFARPVAVNKTNEKGEEVQGQVRFLRYYTVFNVEQIEGLPEDCYPKLKTPLSTSDRIESMDGFAQATKAVIQQGGGRAYYAADADIVQMPPFERFESKEAYYGVLLHELIHWTGHSTRLDRGLGTQKPPSEGYANEELVAELGAAFLCAELGVTPQIREGHAAYLKHWLSILKEDNRAIFRAAAQAQRAADYLKFLQLQPEPPAPRKDGAERASDAPEAPAAPTTEAPNQPRPEPPEAKPRTARKSRRARASAPAPA